MCKKIADRIKILMISLLLVALPVQPVLVSAAEPVPAVESIKTKISLNKKKLTLNEGKSFRLKITGTTARSWKSSRPAVAAVGSKGLVKAKKEGTAVISCRAADGKTYKCRVTVRKAAAATPTPTPQNPAAPTEEQVYNAMIALKDQYPNGMEWTNDNFYAWKGGAGLSGGYGCVGFAMILSDAAFGSAPARKLQDFSRIRVGDILSIYGGSHTVIALEVKEDSVIVAEGNINSSILWGREISMDEIRGSGEFMMTRYPD